MIWRLLLFIILTIGGAAVSSVPVLRGVGEKAPFVLAEEVLDLSAERGDAAAEDPYEARRFPSLNSVLFRSGFAPSGRLLPAGRRFAQPGTPSGRPLYLLHHSFLFYDLG